MILVRDGQTTLKELVVNTERIQNDILREGTETRAATKDVVRLESSLTRTHISSKLDAQETSHVLRDQRERVLNSLKFESMYARENASPINQSHEGTFQWVFDDVSESDTSSDDVSGSDSSSDDTSNAPEPVWNSFVDWLQSDEKFYWISGKPGSGKSSLIRYLVLDPRTTNLLQRRPSAENTKVLRSFIWAAGNSIQRSQKGVLATLLHELLSDEAMPIDQVTKQYRMKRSIEDWSLKELQDSLQYTLRQSIAPSCIFIDGLDEIDSREFGGLRGLVKLIKSLAQIPNTKFCLGSRPEPLLAMEFAQLPQLRLQDLTWGDMRKHVKESLREIHERYITEEEFQDLINTILWQAEGVFLWVSLVTRSICNGLIADEWDTLLERVKQLPSDLHDLYHDMWNRMNKEDQQLYQSDAASYFSLVCQRLEDRGRGPGLFVMMIATKPELRRRFLAGGQKNDEKSLTRELQIFRSQVKVRCAGLLDVPEVSIEFFIHQFPITFIHKSARDFIQDTQEGKRILQCDKIGSRKLRLWSHVAEILNLSMLRHTLIDHSVSNLWRTLKDLQYLFRHVSMAYIRSIVNLVRIILQRSSWWDKVLRETPLDYILARSHLHSYNQHRIQELTTSTHGDKEMLNELLCCQLSELRFSSPRDILNHIIPTLHILLDSGTDINFQSAQYNLPEDRHNTVIIGLLSNLSIFVWLDEFEEVVFELLQLLYKIIDSGADLESRTLVALGSWNDNLKFWTICMSKYWREESTRKLVFSEEPTRELVILAEMTTRHLLLYLNTRAVDWLLTREASSVYSGQLRPLENLTTLEMNGKWLLVINESVISYTEEKIFKIMASTAHVFEDIHERFKDPSLKWNQYKDVWISQLISLSLDYTASFDDILQWMLEKGYVSEKAGLWVQTHSAQEFLYRNYYIGGFEIDIVAGMDWSYRPEYNNLLAVIDQTMNEEE